MNKLIFIT